MLKQAILLKTYGGKIVQYSKGQNVKKGDGGLEIKLGEYFRTCAIEVGISETLANLREDMMTWFNNGVDIVLLVNISEAERFRSLGSDHRKNCGDFVYERPYARGAFTRAMKKKPLGEFKYRGITWYSGISQLTVGVCKSVHGQN
ncbi:hypothetical protein V1508DRAFT_434395 [Lipomyces doorenjongii]|uniref:uncharacterized protein n=1 Tax=Lipomyces doorenjongii TaxID=383834 RepID=UPI0034CFE1A1